MTQTLIAGFDTRAAADRAQTALIYEGFERKQINITSHIALDKAERKSPGRPSPAVKLHNRAIKMEAQRTIAGVALMGALIGIIVGVVLSFIFGTQEPLAAPLLRDPLSSGIAGLVFGTGLGALLGAVLGIGTTEEMSLSFKDTLTDSKYVLSLNLEYRNYNEAQRILKQAGALQVFDWSEVNRRTEADQIHGIKTT